MAINSVSLLRYLGISVDDIKSDDQNLVNKGYVDHCFYPFSSDNRLTTATNGEFKIVPSASASYWSVVSSGAGTIVIEPAEGNYDNYSMFTFELMVVKTADNSNTIGFSSDINWIGNEPTINYGSVYFFAFRTIYLNGSWKILGNLQGTVPVNE